MAKQKLNDTEFANAWNGSITQAEAAEKAGMTAGSAYKRMLSIRKEQGWHFEMLPPGSSAKKEAATTGKGNRIAKRPARKQEDLNEHQKDPAVAYAAGIFDMVGILDVKEMASRQARLMLRLASAKREVISEVHTRFGGVMEEREGQPLTYTLSWATPEEMHSFLSHIQPHSKRWSDDIPAILQWLESLVEFKWNTEELLKIYQRTSTEEEK